MSLGVQSNEQEVQNLRVENAALRDENLKLQRRIVKIETTLTSAKDKIRAVQELVAISEFTDAELETREAANAKDT